MNGCLGERMFDFLNCQTIQPIWGKLSDNSELSDNSALLTQIVQLLFVLEKVLDKAASGAIMND